MNLHISQFVLSILTLPSLTSTRGVNISNTWMLPEEGFPVFYRYFRDRISWYEADAVCQFHHANLVTADSTSQYDAIRAYLKELDITENIWIGLSKTANIANFIWTSFRPLNGDGHWEQQIPQSRESLCVSMDPSADFLWKVMTCGGPDVASFICELSVPSWATGPKGCLLTELPSMTVLYIPEQLAIELTSDCGLDGTKRITCRGNADREEILKQLTCAISSDDFEDKTTTKLPNFFNFSSSTPSDVPSDISSNSKTTKPWIWTSNTVDTDYGMPTRHRRETENTVSPVSTKSTSHLPSSDSVELGTSSEGDISLYTTEFQNTNKFTEAELSQAVGATTQGSIIESNLLGVNSGYVTNEEKPTEKGDGIEYPINQGHLFTIIENGTITFDLVEVNETTSENSERVQSYSTESTTNIANTSATQNSTGNLVGNNLYTTVIYNKEPPSEISYVTNRSPRKYNSIKDSSIQNSVPVKSSQQSTNKVLKAHNKLGNKNKIGNTLSKEITLDPVAEDVIMKLNRTYRKEVPSEKGHSSNSTFIFKSPLFKDSKTNKLGMGNEKHKHVEIKWNEGEEKNFMELKLFVTTRKTDVSSLGKEKIEVFANSENETLQTLGSKTDMYSLNGYNVTENNNSENFSTLKSKKTDTIFNKPPSVENKFLSKPLVGKIGTIIYENSVSPLPSEFLQSEPQLKPNRQRQLTRTQRKSFYPYFFSRVLG